MIKRLCPVCDGEIKVGHFCPGCRQWIREPKMVNVTYYLNERHPKGETDCLYHNGPQEFQAPPKQAVKRADQLPKKSRTEKNKPGRRPADRNKKKSGKGYKAVWIVLAVYLIIMFFVPLMRLIFSMLETLFFFL